LHVPKINAYREGFGGGVIPDLSVLIGDHDMYRRTALVIRVFRGAGSVDRRIVAVGIGDLGFMAFTYLKIDNGALWRIGTCGNVLIAYISFGVYVVIYVIRGTECKSAVRKLFDGIVVRFSFYIRYGNRFLYLSLA